MLFQFVLGYVSVVIQKAEWSCIKMANGEHYAVIIGKPQTIIIISWCFSELLTKCLGTTIRRELKTFARS